LRYIVEKGSIAIDGISLTVNRVDAQGFDVSIIPHTQTATTLTASHEQGGEAHQEFAAVDQVAAELAYFGECIREGREPEPSGREGLHDVVVIEAIRKSLETGLAQQLTLEDLPGPRPSMARFMPPPVSPKVVVGVSDPHR